VEESSSSSSSAPFTESAARGPTMTNGRRFEASASAASYDKRQPRHCSHSASRRLARGCPHEKPKRKPSTKTKTLNENLKRKPFSLSLLVLGWSLRYYVPLEERRASGATP